MKINPSRVGDTAAAAADPPSRTYGVAGPPSRTYGVAGPAFVGFGVASMRSLYGYLAAFFVCSRGVPYGVGVESRLAQEVILFI